MLVGIAKLCKPIASRTTKTSSSPKVIPTSKIILLPMLVQTHRIKDGLQVGVVKFPNSDMVMTGFVSVFHSRSLGPNFIKI